MAANRIDETFAALRREGRKGLIGYLTYGDPDLDQSENDIREALRSGLDILELGVPYSDPTADGPTIQEASQRALSAGANLERVLDFVGRLRTEFDTPIVLFGYANPFYRHGFEASCEAAGRAGVDGFLIVDLPKEESPEVRAFMDQHGLHLIPLIAPTTGRERAAGILENAGGFVYYIMVTGVTGARESLAEDLAFHIGELRAVTSLPIAVGFGLSSGSQAHAAAEHADAAVVGSALIKAAHAGKISEFLHELRSGLDAGISPQA